MDSPHPSSLLPHPSVSPSALEGSRRQTQVNTDSSIQKTENQKGEQSGLAADECRYNLCFPEPIDMSKRESKTKTI
jgi:hypothetical protein